jgi:hypothetical protein
METVLLLVGSNLFMTYAWYGHLRTLRSAPWYVVVFASWGGRVLRVRAPGPRQPHWLRPLLARPAQDHAGDDHAGGLRAVFHRVHEGSAQLVTAFRRHGSPPAEHGDRGDPQKLWDVRPLLKLALVEAPGIETGKRHCQKRESRRDLGLLRPTLCPHDSFRSVPPRTAGHPPWMQSLGNLTATWREVTRAGPRSPLPCDS